MPGMVNSPINPDESQNETAQNDHDINVNPDESQNETAQNNHEIYADPEETEECERSEEASKKLVETLGKWIDSEAQNTFFLVKDHPRGEETITSFANKIKGMLEALLLDGAVPILNEATKEEIENSLTTFWTAKRANIKRSRQSE